jgi:hypothetical protein
MHDPMTVAFQIGKLVTIWHVDPEKDGSDDSCGWFIRSRHLDPKMLDKIASRFNFEWSHGVPAGWFADNGEPNWSTHSIVMHMVQIVTGEMWGYWSRRQERFIRRNLWHILRFAENSCDSAYTSINQSYGRDPRETPENRARNAASMMYSWVARQCRPWWQHPRWHVWHWKIQVHHLLMFKRWLFSRCCKCGKGFRWGESPVSGSWYGTGPLWFRSEQHIYHSNCDGASAVAGSAEKGTP